MSICMQLVLRNPGNTPVRLFVSGGAHTGYAPPNRSPFDGQHVPMVRRAVPNRRGGKPMSVNDVSDGPGQVVPVRREHDLDLGAVSRRQVSRDRVGRYDRQEAVENGGELVGGRALGGSGHWLPPVDGLLGAALVMQESVGIGRDRLGATVLTANVALAANIVRLVVIGVRCVVGILFRIGVRSGHVVSHDDPALGVSPPGHFPWKSADSVGIVVLNACVGATISILVRAKEHCCNGYGCNRQQGKNDS